eukprot:Nk52_evm22s1524 gene=Nk52_evmTU22s1524
MDIETLFKEKSIADIRQLEKQTKNDIERRKEDMRQMVGERYRDLIDAADTILSMKQACEKVVYSIDCVQREISSLKEGSMLLLRAQEERERQSGKRQKPKFFEIATQMKVLVDTPEYLWSALEQKEYMKAALLYLLAKQIFTNIRVSSESGQAATSSSSNLLKSFPILPQQWSAISHFREDILTGCRQLLHVTSASEQSITHALCGIILLDERSPRQVFLDFLNARRDKIISLFNVKEHATVSVKSHVCVVADAIKVTLENALSIFYCKETAGYNVNAKVDVDSLPLLYRTLYSISQHAGAGAEDEDSMSTVLMLFGRNAGMSALARHLPSSVQNFRPTISAIRTLIPPDFIQKQTEDWLAKCIKHVSTGGMSMLEYVGNMKGLVAIRNALWEKLDSGCNNANVFSWENVCDAVLGRKLSLWNDVFKSVIDKRMYSIVEEEFQKISISTRIKQEIAAIKASDGAIDMATYLWDSDNDLSLCALGIDPNVKDICQEIDEQLMVVLNDIKTALAVPEHNSCEDFNTTCKLLVHHVRSCFQGAIESLSNELLGEISLLRKENLEGSKERIIDSIFFCANLSKSLCLHSKAIPAIVNTPPAPNTRGGSHHNSNTNLYSSTKRTFHKFDTDEAAEELLKSTRDTLHKVLVSAFSFWKGWLVTTTVLTLEQAIVSMEWSFNLPWEKIEIKEENEDGELVASHIKIPCSCSMPVSNLLFSLVEELNRVGGHSVETNVTKELCRNLCFSVAELYADFLDITSERHLKCSQDEYLQLLFDLRYLFRVLVWHGSVSSFLNLEESKKISSLLVEYENKIDPFDYEVFSGYMENNFERYCQRTFLLNGLLAHNHKRVSVKSNGAEVHNLLPLSECSERFGLVPMSESFVFDHEQTPQKKKEANIGDKSSKRQSTSRKGLLEQMGKKAAASGISEGFKNFLWGGGSSEDVHQDSSGFFF